jgi:D-beta-D-heptose 7-phosphate kinase/D-beta-D-heptose 1-phosphate adenosyltransferase
MTLNKIKKIAHLKKIIKDLKAKGKKIVFTNGCFDILHYGHVKYLEKARRYGDILLVAINSDKSVKAIKGRGRPIVPGSDRARMVAALEPVNYITTFNGLTPLKTIQALKPDVLVKGGDWRKEDIIGKDFVESYDGKVVRIPYIKGYSTSSIIKKIKGLD